MISNNLQDAFNNQIAAELWSSNLYLQMAFYFTSEGWDGLASWLYKHSVVERGHGLDMADFVLKRGGLPSIAAMDEVPVEWAGAESVFEYVYMHECHVTDLINQLYEVAEADGDRAAMNFIDKYVNEQVSEEVVSRKILNLIRHASGSEASLMGVDATLAKMD